MPTDAAPSPPDTVEAPARRLRLLFASAHCYLDPASGAAQATRDLLELLAPLGWDCRVLCGPVRDAADAPPLADALAAQGLSFEARDAPAEGFSVLHCRPGGVPAALFAPHAPPGGRPGRAGGLSGPHAEAFLALVGRTLDAWRPDLVLTYGGDALARRLIARVADAGPVAFGLHNFAYHDAGLFGRVAAVLVPSEFARRHYERALGLWPVAPPYPLNPDRCLAPESADRRFVTFVNPVPEKGLAVFARLAAELGRRRPDVPLLVVEGRGKAAALDRCGLGLRSHPNLHVLANTPDPREVYRRSRAVLVPSLWEESFGRVAAEAMLNGLPVLAGDRGALPETVADGGFVLPLPARLGPAATDPPAAAEVGPWVDTLLRLWDDPAAYEAASRRARAAAARFAPDRSAAAHDALFRGLVAGRGGPAPFGFRAAGAESPRP